MVILLILYIINWILALLIIEYFLIGQARLSMLHEAILVTVGLILHFVIILLWLLVWVHLRWLYSSRVNTLILILLFNGIILYISEMICMIDLLLQLNFFLHEFNVLLIH